MHPYTETGRIYVDDAIYKNTATPDYDFDKLKDYLINQNCPFIEDISDLAIMNGASQIIAGREFGLADFEIIDLTLGVLPSSMMARIILEYFDQGATEITGSFG